MKYDSISQAYLTIINPPVPLTEDVLMEDRIDFIKSKYPEINTSHDNFGAHRKAADVVDFLAANADPTKNKAYTPWIVKAYHAGTFQQEDAPRVHAALANFHKYKGKLDVSKRDINQYRTVSDVADATDHLRDTPVTKSEAREFARTSSDIPGKHEKTYEDEHIKIYHVADEATSQRMYASKDSKDPGAFPTEWCTAWPNDSSRSCHFSRYANQGPLFAVHRKRDGEVYQFHPATDSFMDKNDNSIKTADFNEMKPHMSAAISQNFDKYFA